MTVINPNSISGIASVTAQGDIIQFYKSDGTLGAVQFDGANFNTTSGVSTFKNLYVGGTLTYEDVKNVDSVGIVTARDGIKVTGGTLNVTNSENTLGILSSTDDGANLDLYDNDTQSRIRTVDGQLQLRADVGSAVADSSIRFFVDGANEKLRITNDGKVGIGSQIPADTLDVHGNARFGAKNTSDAQLQLGRAGSGNRNAYIDFVGDNTYTDYGLRIIRKNAGPNSESQITHRGTGDFTIGTNEAAALRFATTSEERLRIESGGKIAIGNFSGATHDIHIKHANSPGIKIEDTTQSSKLLLFAQDANTGIGNFSNHDLVFYTNSTPVFRIDNDGKVGIGTDDADALLHLQSSDARLRWTDADGAADNKHWDLGSTSANLLRLQAKSDAGGGGGNLFDFYRSGNQITEFRGMKAGAYWFIIDNDNQRVGIGTDDPDAEGLLSLHTDANDETLIRFDTGSPTDRRPWAFKQKDTGTATALRLQALSNGKTFCVTNSSGTDHFLVHTASADPYVRMSAQVRLDDEIVHTGDDDTKISFATNTIQFDTAGSPRLKITSGGSALFGGLTSQDAAQDSSKLAVQGGGSNIGIIQVHAGGGESAGDLSGITFSHGADNTTARAKAAIALEAIASYGKGDLCFYVDGAADNNQVAAADERLRITSGGKVGIGTDNPVGNLEVRDAKANLIVAKDGLTVKANSTLHTTYDLIQLGAGGALASYSTATATADTQFIHNAYRHSGGNWKYRYADTAMRLKMNSPGGAFIFESAASGSADGDITFSEKLRITSGGTIETKGYDGQCFKFNSDVGHGARNVQIWANADSGNWHSFVGSNLTHDGTNYLKPSDQANQNWGNIAGIVFEGSNANNNSGNHPAIRFLVDLPAGNGLNYSLGSTKTAAIDNKTAACITASGNFGIGTENPTSSLVVEGTIIANNGTLQVDKHIVDGTDDWAGASYILHNKRTFTNGSWTNYFKFDRSDTAADNNDVGVFAGHLHIVYLNDRSNSVHTTGYDVFPFIVRGRSNNTISGNFGSAVVDLHEVIGSSVEVRFDSATASVIYIQIKIYNSDAGGSERLCHAWIDGGGVANLSNRFLYPEITT